MHRVGTARSAPLPTLQSLTSLFDKARTLTRRGNGIISPSPAGGGSPAEARTASAGGRGGVTGDAASRKRVVGALVPTRRAARGDLPPAGGGDDDGARLELVAGRGFNFAL